MTLKGWSSIFFMLFSANWRKTGKNKLFVWPTMPLRIPSTQHLNTSVPHKYQRAASFLRTLIIKGPLPVYNSQQKTACKGGELCNLGASGSTVCSPSGYGSAKLPQCLGTAWMQLRGDPYQHMERLPSHSSVVNY